MKSDNRSDTLNEAPERATQHESVSYSGQENCYPPPEVGSAPGWPVVLYFHHVNPDIQHYTSITPADFDRALTQLDEQFDPLSPQEVSNVQEATGNSRPTCLLTFDDGYADVFDYALPIMERRGWRAVLFVSVDHIGTVEQHPVRGPLRHMNWEQLEAAISRGHVVASHGSAHIPFDRLDANAAQADLDKSLRVLKERLSDVPDWFAYPYGMLSPFDLRLPSLCFGSIKAPARPWSAAPQEIRRTYLPVDKQQEWKSYITKWS